MYVAQLIDLELVGEMRGVLVVSDDEEGAARETRWAMVVTTGVMWMCDAFASAPVLIAQRQLPQAPAEVVVEYTAGMEQARAPVVVGQPPVTPPMAIMQSEELGGDTQRHESVSHHHPPKQPLAWQLELPAEQELQHRLPASGGARVPQPQPTSPASALGASATWASG